MTMGITVDVVGRRHYFRGDTYGVKDKLRAAGAHWDADERAWWIGKRDVAERLRAELVTKSTEQKASAEDAPKSDRQIEAVDDRTVVRGRAWYKGKEYLLLWDGNTKRGYAAKLAFTDGSKVFWADGSAIQVTKIYETRVWRGQEQPMTFGKLRRFREARAAERQEDKALEKTSGLVGERGSYQSQYEADKHDRTPGKDFGTAAWLRHRGQLIAVVLVGYEPARYVRGEDAEDMGHYGVENGYYGVAHYRAATTEEYAELQSRSFRTAGVCTSGVEPEAVTDLKASHKAQAEQEAAREALVAWIVKQIEQRSDSADDHNDVRVPADAWSMRLDERGNEHLYLSSDAVYVVRRHYDYPTTTRRLAIDAGDVSTVCAFVRALSTCTRHRDCRACHELALACSEAA